MTLTVKDSPVDSALGKPSSSSQNSENSSNPSPRSNPVCLEVPIVIRSSPSENADASGPIREEGRTVIVFDNGAVIRISRQLPTAQTYILSNQQGREVVCRAMGGRNLPNKGYIEIEFAEQADDFWRIHQSSAPTSSSASTPTLTPASEPVRAPAGPVQVTPAAMPDEPSVPTPAFKTSFTAQRPAPDSETNVPSGRAPSFEDVAGLVRMRPAKEVQENSEKKQDKRIEAAIQALKSMEESSANPAETGKSATSTSSPVKVTPLISELPSEKPAVPAPRETASAAARKPSQPDVLAGKGVLASPYVASASTAGESRKPMPLIVGGAALVLVGFGAGYFLMHRGAAPRTPEVAAVSQPSIPAAPVSSTAPAALSQPPLNSAPALTQAPPQALQPISAPATVDKEVPAEETLESQSARSSAREPVAGQPDRFQAHRPAISHSTIPNLTMKSPAAPNRSQMKGGDSASIGAAEVNSAIASGAASIPGVMRAQPAPPVAVPTPPLSKSVREPQLISSTRPVYPTFAKQSNVQGTVVVTARVDPKGNVVEANAVSGPPFLRQAATDAVRQWKYSPALIDGLPAGAVVTISLDFRLN